MTPSDQSNHIILSDFFLAGGGHAHALLIKKYAMNPWPGVRLNLISDCFQTPYSGMLTGLIAGDYHYDDAHIDLAKLCQWAKIRIFYGKITGFDLRSQLVMIDKYPPMKWDALIWMSNCQCLNML